MVEHGCKWGEVLEYDIHYGLLIKYIYIYTHVMDSNPDNVSFFETWLLYTTFASPSFLNVGITRFMRKDLLWPMKEHFIIIIIIIIIL